LAVPRLIKFAGTFKDAQGKPLSNTVGLTFAIYKDQEGGAPLWLETQNAQLDEQGHYTVLLGATKSEGLPLELFSSGAPRWLGVQVQLPGEVEAPRVLLVSVPYALKSADADTLGGIPASAFVLAQPSSTASGTGVLGSTTTPASGNSKTPDKATASSRADTAAAAALIAATPAGRVYVPIAPCRIVDTRLPSPNPLVANTTRTFNVVGSTNDFVGQGGNAGGCGIPGFLGPSMPQAQAVMFNFVAVDVAGAGDLRAWATDHAVPLASILNYAAVPGLNLANGIIVPVRQDLEGSDISVRADVSGAELVVDVVGYFSDFAPGQVVRSVSGQTDNVTVNGSNGLSVSAGGGTVTVTSNATSTNTLGAIVSRDGSGNFSAGTITGNLTGNATSASNFSGSLAGEVTGSQGATVVSNAVSANTANAVVRRDGSGNFSAGTVALGGNLALPNATSGGTTGVIQLGGVPFLHNFGGNNTFVGASAGNTSASLTGTANTGVGSSALNANTTGGNNAAFGFGALASNTTGVQNSAFGDDALFANTTACCNAAFGSNALTSNTASSNSAFGSNALTSNTTGIQNSAFGSNALQANTTASNNSAFGVSALQANTTGFSNSAFGGDALHSNTMGVNNSAFGGFALHSNTTGVNNAAFGISALSQLTSGDLNIAIGESAGFNLTTGSSNIYIGHFGAFSESNAIRIGSGQTATFIAGISGATSSTGVAVLVNSSGQLGTILSSRRFKHEIADLGGESDLLLKLRPVAFYYKPELDDTHTRQYGLVAEEVAQVAPQLVVFDKDGAPQTVRYHFVNAMLLNEVQKQRAIIVRQESKIQDLEARLAKLEAAIAGR
jgi:hypothetical protein